jgi:hypothetical protein
VDKKKSEITDSNAKILVVFCIGAAILLLYFPPAGRQPLNMSRPTHHKTQQVQEVIWPPGLETLQPRKAAPAARKRTFPDYPWNVADAAFMADIEIAQRSISGEIPSERRLAGHVAEDIFNRRISLPKGELSLAQLRNHIEKKAEVKVIADMDAWASQPSIKSHVTSDTVGGIMLFELCKNPGIECVVMKNHEGEVCIFVLGPRTRD